MRRLAVAALASGLLAALLAPALQAQQGEKGSAPLHVVHRDGIALEGYDAIAYVRHNEARRGLPIFVVEHGGYEWYFESDLNAERFRSDPGRFIPAYGGYSAMGLAEGYLNPGDPEVWSVKDGRIYLFYSHSLRRRWLENTSQHIRRADRNWLKFRTP